MTKFGQIADAKGMRINEEDLKGGGMGEDSMQYMLQGYFETLNVDDGYFQSEHRTRKKSCPMLLLLL